MPAPQAQGTAGKAPGGPGEASALPVIHHCLPEARPACLWAVLWARRPAGPDALEMCTDTYTPLSLYSASKPLLGFSNTEWG